MFKALGPPTSIPEKKEMEPKVISESKVREKMVGFQVHATFGEYLETMNMQLLEGKTFSSYSADDSTKVIITERAARDLGFDSPASAIRAGNRHEQTRRRSLLMRSLES